ncbi:hypothetical protein I317_01413 [Kwoniella heveanensis CBS 569]|nr:hypothetical protein I317_01413 [Kwoniella heveanensis CBS 569]
MAQKHKRRQRPSDIEPAATRKEEVSHNWEKSDDELELEEALFGVSRSKSKKKKGQDGSTVHVASASGSGSGSEGEGGGLSDVDDDDLFMVDAPLAPQHQLDLDGAPGDDDDEDVSDLDEDESQGESSSSSVSSSDEDDDEEDEDEDALNEFRAISPSLDNVDNLDANDARQEKGKNRPTITLPEDLIDDSLSPRDNKKGKERQAVWHDPADDLVGVDLSENRRLRKLDRGKKRRLEGELVGGKELQERLREQFERLHPPPAWAKERTVFGTPSLSSLLTSTKSFIAPSSSSAVGRSRPPLPQGTIDLQRLRNANQQNPTTGKREAANAGGGVVDFAWHPSERVGVMAVAGGDRRVRFFNIDGHTNPTLMTLHIPSLPISRSTFHPSGSSLLLVGNRPYYYTYDLSSQRCLRSPRNLFGSAETASSPNSLHRHSFSPDGSLLAVAGRRGAISILDWSNGGSGGVVAEFKSGRGGSVDDFLWSHDGKELSVLGGRDSSEVEVWDLGERRISRKWKDDRALGGVIIKGSKDGAYTAIGSSTGIVNLYSTPTLSASSTSTSSSTSGARKMIELSPEPIKSLEQLTMPISTMDFHPSSEVLVTASTGKKDLLKMYHLPSGTAFSNWPTPATPLGRITSTGFSSSGEYLAVGNQRGNVLLWSLRHYAS